MTDGIIKGAGNSRYLKSVANALALYPTHESLMEALAAGTFPIDLNGINPAGWNIMGDKLDKATLLTDALCTALGLATTATPTQAMDKLRTLVNGKVSCSFGTYVGNGAESRIVYMPGTIKAMVLLANGLLAFNSTSSEKMYWGGIFGPGKDLVVTPEGYPVASVSGAQMTVYYKWYDNVRNGCLTNSNGATYYYICFY